MDFENDIRSEIFNRVKSPRLEALLAADSTSHLLSRYLGWRKRFIHAKKRMVHLSSVLRATVATLTALERDNVRILLEQIEAGGDLTPRLSRNIKVFFEPRPPVFASNKVLKKTLRRDHDMLLYDWDVHHLHLSDVLDKRNPDGFNVRGNLVLFAIFRWDDAFIIDVCDHKSFAARRLAEIIIDNWPQLDVVHHMPEVIGFEYEISDGERSLLRNHGISSSGLKHRGKCYHLGTGYASDGSSISATRRAIQIVLAAKRWEEQLAADPSTYRTNCRVGRTVPLELRCVLQKDDSWAIVDVSSNTGFRLL